MQFLTKWDFVRASFEQNGFVKLGECKLLVDAITFLKLKADFDQKEQEEFAYIDQQRAKPGQNGRGGHEDDAVNARLSEAMKGRNKSPGSVNLQGAPDGGLPGQAEANQGAVGEGGEAQEGEILPPLQCAETLEFDCDRDLAHFVDQTMSDLPHYCNVPDKVRVFNKRDVLLACENIESNTEKVQSFRPTLRQIAKDNGFRSMLAVNDELITRLKDLTVRFPNFSEVVEHYIAEFQIRSLMPIHKWKTFPVLLNGNGGIGKTAFAKALSKVLDVPYFYQNLGGTSASFILNGSSAQWGSSKVGLLLKAFAQSPVACPLFLLDEIDKIGSDPRFALEPIMLQLLESETSRSMVDEYANLSYNASNGIFIGTSNDVSLISRPLQTRFEIFNIRAPNSKQRRVIAQSIATENYPDLIFDAQALDYIARIDVNLREMDRLISKVVHVVAAQLRERTVAGGGALESHANVDAGNECVLLQGSSSEPYDEQSKEEKRVTAFHVQHAFSRSKFSNRKLLDYCVD